MTGQLADLANVDDDQAAAAFRAHPANVPAAIGAEDQADKPAPVVPMHWEQLADLIAARVVDQLHDLRLDAPAVPLLELCRQMGSFYFRTAIAYVGTHVLEAEGSLHADRIELRLTVDGGQRIWTATLREPEGP